MHGLRRRDGWRLQSLLMLRQLSRRLHQRTVKHWRSRSSARLRYNVTMRATSLHVRRHARRMSLRKRRELLRVLRPKMLWLLLLLHLMRLLWLPRWLR